MTGRSVIVLLTAAFAALAGPSAAQTDEGFFVTPLDDPAEGGEGAQGGFGLDAGQGQDIGGDGAILFQDNAGQSGVALIERANPSAPQEPVAPEAETGSAALLRALDKTVGRPTDLEVAAGETVVFGRIAIRMVECRYPVDNPASDAWAHLEIADLEGRELFDGWMVASSPALMALEHSRYDVWVLRCNTS